MAKKATNAGKGGKRPNVVGSAKRGGPPRGFYVALGVVAVIGITALTWSATRKKDAATTLDPALPSMEAKGYVIGSPTAPVEVVEFADFECPGCGQFATLTGPDVKSRLVNTGQIRLRFMDFPLNIHQNTLDAHHAAACANDQGKFWEMHDQIFATQDRWNGEATKRPRGPLADLARGLALDMAAYESCMEAGTHRAQILANVKEGERRGVAQTPSFIIGGKLVPGALPFDSFKKLVDAELAKTPAVPAGAATPLGDTALKPK